MNKKPHYIEPEWGPTGTKTLAHQRTCSRLLKKCYAEFSDEERDKEYEDIFKEEILAIQRAKIRSGRT